MHELGLATAILDTAREIAGGRPLLRVAVSVGVAQAVSVESLEFGFAVATAGSDDDMAQLQTRVVAGESVRIDEVEVGGDSPEVLRRGDVEVAEPPHVHAALAGDDPHRHPAWR